MKWIRITFLIISVVVLFVIAYAIINSMVSYKYEMEEPPKLYEINIEFAVGYLKSQITWLWCFLGYVAISIIILLRSMFDRKNNRSKMKRFISLLVTLILLGNLCKLNAQIGLQGNEKYNSYNQVLYIDNIEQK